MKIAVIGAGAMGLLFSGYLSAENETYLIGRNENRLKTVQDKGVLITEKDGTSKTFFPKATTDSAEIGTVDYVILLTKSMDSHTALAAHRSLIGKDTILMTLQNGAGHESVLQKFAPSAQIAIGTTQDGSSIKAENEIMHSGVGRTAIGMIANNSEKLIALQETFIKCGFDTVVSEDINQLVWDKLMINSSSSVLSGLLNMPQGYCVDDADAFEVIKLLIHESVAVANADGAVFDEAEQIARIETHLKNARGGLVSVYADLNAGRFTEVDAISGSVIKKGRALGIPTPTHKLIRRLIHALERRAAYQL